MYRVNDKVSVDDPDRPGVWIVRSVGPKNYVLDPVGGGRGLRCPHSMAIEPTTEPAPARPTVYYHPGELIRVSGRFAGLYAVNSDRGGKTVILAKLGGDNGRKLSVPRRGLVKVDPADVLIPDATS
jgi:hypothetical protein